MPALQHQIAEKLLQEWAESKNEDLVKVTSLRACGDPR
jgi:hypothetical protein